MLTLLGRLRWGMGLIVHLFQWVEKDQYTSGSAFIVLPERSLSFPFLATNQITEKFDAYAYFTSSYVTPVDGTQYASSRIRASWHL